MSAKTQTIQLPSLCPYKRYAALAPSCYWWWGTKGVNGAHGESGSTSPRVWGGAPSRVHRQSKYSERIVKIGQYLAKVRATV